jgi:uncharacterized protein with PIN domain
MQTAFGYRCEYCDGIISLKRIEREAFKHRQGFVILEDVVIGICDRCGTLYYVAETLRRVHEVASGTVPAERVEHVPVAHAGQ